MSTSPVTAWDYYNKFHLRRKLEVLPLKVGDYTKQVAADPSERTDLAGARPADLARLRAHWDSYARRNRVILPNWVSGY